MDEPTDCGKNEGKNYMSEGDMFIVQSDSYGGNSEVQHQSPAECFKNFNLGDRRIGVEVTKFKCTGALEDQPFVAIYSSCDHKREGLLVSESQKHRHSTGPFPLYYDPVSNLRWGSIIVHH